MKTAKFQYKCRMCGVTHSEYDINPDMAISAIVASIQGKWVYFDSTGPLGRTPQLKRIHTCDETRTGVSDLIGYVVEDVK